VTAKHFMQALADFCLLSASNNMTHNLIYTVSYKKEANLFLSATSWKIIGF